MFCRHCGNEILQQAVICVRCGCSPSYVRGTSRRKSRLAYVLLGIFLGHLGIHNFYAGRTGQATAQLLITLFLSWLIIPIVIVFIWVLIEVCTVKLGVQGQVMK